jgi:katanin p60 ATPase-containing subunit A1
MELAEPIKQALAKAKDAYEQKDFNRAAASYEQAANLMSIFAEQSIGRDAELRRKKKAIEYREIARKLRSGEFVAAPTGPAAAADDQPSQEKPQQAGGGSEVRGIVSQLVHHSSITWDDIGGLDETKNEIKFALGITLAQQPPNVQLSSWTKMLFYGPPGTGKTLLAAATSNAVKNSEGVASVFYNVKVSSVLSKYFGESSKIVSELYGVARDTSPSVVFLDEFESICGKRGEAADTGPERRILSTLLSELDGMDSKGRRDIYVLTIAATNRPWDLDEAVLSRFEKKILIPLPDMETRKRILQIQLGRKGFKTVVTYDELGAMTEGFSGRELERFVKEVTSRMVAEMNREIPGLIDRGLDVVQKYRIKVRDLTKADFDRARAIITPMTTAADMQKFIRWQESNVT